MQPARTLEGLQAQLVATLQEAQLNGLQQETLQDLKILGRQYQALLRSSLLSGASSHV